MCYGGPQEAKFSLYNFFDKQVAPLGIM